MLVRTPPGRFRAAAALWPAAALLAGCQTTTPPPTLLVGLQEIAAGLTSPLRVVQPPDGSGRLFIVDQAGFIRVVSGGNLLVTPFLDLRARMVTLNAGYDERGLLGLAFHPQYAMNGKLFVYYSAPRGDGIPNDFDHESHVSEFTVSGDANVGDPDSERVVLRVGEPQANHNGGDLAFGPDGMLYIALGDGGAANDVGTGHTPTLGNGQDRSTLLGKILRIDVAGMPYTIPADNPFVGVSGARGEIWALGFRNPYRIAFDPGGSQRLFVGDVGQNRREEVTIVAKGENHGWPIREGLECFNMVAADSPLASCATTDAVGAPLIEPILTYGHPGLGGTPVGVSVVGGHVVRSGAIAALADHYIFGDWSQSFVAPDGRLYRAAESGGSWSVEEIGVEGRAGNRLGAFLLGFGQDANGDVYVCTTQNLGPSGSTGRVHKIIPPEANP